MAARWTKQASFYEVNHKTIKTVHDLLSDFDMTWGQVGFSDFGEMPFGACEDPVRWVHHYDQATYRIFRTKERFVPLAAGWIFSSKMHTQTIRSICAMPRHAMRVACSCNQLINRFES
jgi:hypothetical protein